ncbi:MAG: ComEC/Rec2 family competence protein [Treponema sp.]|jgi:competence protein ComEC|nr:ComEC/Rec2 family competence protein [Treponema sp.]
MKTSFLFCSAFGGVLGYYALSLFSPPVSLVLAACALPAVFAAGKIMKKDSSLSPAALAVAAALGLAAGCVSGTAARKPFSPGLPPEKITLLKGTLLDDPRTGRSGGGFANLAVSSAGAGNLPGCDTVRSSADGTVMVFFPDSSIPRLTEFGRGGEIFVEGAFSKRADRAGVFGARAVHLVTPSSPLEQFRTGARSSLVQSLYALDKSGLAAALLLGSRDNLDQGLADSYREAGLSHILALSGMHLSFFSGILAFLLKKPLGKKAAAGAGLLFIAVFVFMVGPQPSLVRAAIMYAIGVWAVLFGMPKHTLAFLAAAFLLQIAIDPVSGFSVSFMLSYAALAGLLLLGNKLAFLMNGRVPPFLAGALSASLGAFIASAPFVSAFFGDLRPGGIISGIVIVPLTTLFMALSLMFLASGGFLPPAASAVLAFLEKCITVTVSAAAGIPGVPAPFYPVLAASVFLAGLVCFAENRLGKYRNRLEPFA